MASPLQAFLAGANLSQYTDQIITTLGATEVADLSEVDDSDLTAMGMSPVEIRRFRRKLADGGTATSVPATLVVPDYDAKPAAGPPADIPGIGTDGGLYSHQPPQPVMAQQQQPMMMNQQSSTMMMPPGQGPAPAGQFGGGLFGCFDDMEICLCGYCCAWCLAGQTHERAGLPSGPAWKIPTFCCVGCVANTLLIFVCFGVVTTIVTDIVMLNMLVQGRNTMRTKLGYQPEDTATAWATYCCCTACAICQVHAQQRTHFLSDG
jgi:Cys-rich protein (TIGR01571 family)